jgi:hypothetical protein
LLRKERGTPLSREGQRKQNPNRRKASTTRPFPPETLGLSASLPLQAENDTRYSIKGGRVIWDPIEWLLLLLILLLLVLIFLLLRRMLPPAQQPAPWVMYDSIGVPQRVTHVACGGNGVLTINQIKDLQVLVEIENYGDCEVTLSTNQPILTAKGGTPVAGLGVPPGTVSPTYVSAFIPLPKGGNISYQCKADADQTARCTFRVRVTVR